MQRNSKYFELIVSILLLAGSCFMLYIAQTTGKPSNDGSLSAMAFPRAIYIAIVVLSVYLIAKCAKWFKDNPKTAENAPAKGTFLPQKSVVTFIAICVYAALWQVIGFSLSTLLFFIAESIYLDRKRPIWLTILIGVIATVVMYAVFGLSFKVALPDPLMNMLRGI